MAAKLRAITVEQYGDICDVVERTYQNIPLVDDAPFQYTSNLARAATNRIIEILDLEIEDPRDA